MQQKPLPQTRLLFAAPITLVLKPDAETITAILIIIHLLI